jgi:hypothetical protein
LSEADCDLNDWLRKRPEPHAELFVTPVRDTAVTYLAMTSTDYRSWYSHDAPTPYVSRRPDELVRFFQDGVAPGVWKEKAVF